MLTKNVNGTDVVCSAEEEAEIRARWLANDPSTPSNIDAEKDRRANAFNDVAVVVALNHENRIRALESKALVSLAQFRQGIKALLS